jgi:hypothetical protein
MKLGEIEVHAKFERAGNRRLDANDVDSSQSEVFAQVGPIAKSVGLVACPISGILYEATVVIGNIQGAAMRPVISDVAVHRILVTNHSRHQTAARLASTSGRS